MFSVEGMNLLLSALQVLIKADAGWQVFGAFARSRRFRASVSFRHYRRYIGGRMD